MIKSYLESFVEIAVKYDRAKNSANWAPSESTYTLLMNLL